MAESVLVDGAVSVTIETDGEGSVTRAADGEASLEILADGEGQTGGTADGEANLEEVIDGEGIAFLTEQEKDHANLLNRDAADQHPIGAITGLEGALAGKQDVIEDLEAIRAGAAKGATAVQEETDPVFSASAAAGITAEDIESWSGKAEPSDIPSTYAGSPSAAGPATRAAAIPYGEVDDTSTATVMTATVPGITELYDGVCAYITNGVITSASGWTLEVNGLGAFPVYQSQAAATRTSTIFNAAYTGLFVYNSKRVEGGCWDYFYGYNSDTNTIAYYIRRYQSDQIMNATLYRYMICFTRKDGKLQPANTTNKTTGTSKNLTTEPFDPHGLIFYYSTTTTVSAGSAPSGSYMWIMHYAIDLRYSFNAGSTLTANKDVYIKCTPQADGMVKLAGNNCIVQDLPTTEDGFVYIHLGRAYSTYQISMELEHPVYIFQGGKLRRWNGSMIPDCPATTDGTFTLKATVSNGAVSYAWVAAT